MILGIVVVLCYFCVNDMVFVWGYDEDIIWRVRVVVFNVRRYIVTGRFFKKRDGDNMWVLEGIRN